MTKVLIIAEDRTGSGLQKLLCTAAQEGRRQRGAPELSFPNFGSVNGNAQLLDACKKYRFYRFKSPKADHVFYVMDARKAWDLSAVVPRDMLNATGRPWVERRDELIPLCQAAMTKSAQHGVTDWPSLAGGFHCHVLIWERESLMLPVLDALGLGSPELEPYGRPHAFELLRERYSHNRARGGYSKSLQGAQFLERIAQSPDLTHRVLASNPSLREILDVLVAL